MADTGQIDGDTPLASLVDVRRELHRVLKDLRAGDLDAQRGGVLVNGYGVLAKIIEYVRDSKHKREVAELHDLLVKKKQPAAATPPPAH